MAEYIERTEELMLAMNAGARAIENTKRYHGAIYTKDVFLESPQEIPYLQAAKVLREVSDAPPADVAPVVHWVLTDEKLPPDGQDGALLVRVFPLRRVLPNVSNLRYRIPV